MLTQSGMAHVRLRNADIRSILEEQMPCQSGPLFARHSRNGDANRACPLSERTVPRLPKPAVSNDGANRQPVASIQLVESRKTHPKPLLIPECLFGNDARNHPHGVTLQQTGSIAVRNRVQRGQAGVDISFCFGLVPGTTLVATASGCWYDDTA